ncbi:MAG: hypothetical protein AABX04_04950 [Nanoarchaeota archaeon]
MEEDTKDELKYFGAVLAGIIVFGGILFGPSYFDRIEYRKRNECMQLVESVLPCEVKGLERITQAEALCKSDPFRDKILSLYELKLTPEEAYRLAGGR